MALLLIGLAGLHLAYALRTGLYFSQDDFAILAYFKTHSATEMVVRFLTTGDLWNFHKILGYLNLRLIFDLFGVNQFGYIFTNHLWHTINVLLVYFIISRLTMDRMKAFFIAVLFNSSYLFYFSNIHEYLVTTFSLMSIWTFLVGKKIRWSILFFVLGLLTKEIGLSVPLVLTAINIYREKSLVPTRWFWLLALVYGGYQASFAMGKLVLPLDHPYVATTNLLTWWHNFRYYVSVKWMVLILMALPPAIGKKSVIFLATFLATLLPALVLKNRQEIYYWYLPSVYLLFYLGMSLPRFTLRSSFLYLALFLFLGGRGLLPIVARRSYPNWQLESIRQVLSKVQTEIKNNPKIKTIDLKEVKMERDAGLMVGSGVVDLFLPRLISDKYLFEYNQNENELQVKPLK